jgi:NAD-dependent deacetylase
MDDITRFGQLMRKASRGVAFTGAGISTESGIPDYRGPQGVWNSETPVYYQDFMASREARVRAWQRGVRMYHRCGAAKPNDGHLILTELQRRGHIATVITQNIDGLHIDAGNENVIELHGTNRFAACQHCWKEWPAQVIIERVEKGDEAPECDTCGGPIKARTISFGQAMPEREMRLAMEASLNADLYVSIGSSLVVEPAASFPRLAKQAGAALVIINNQETPLDDIADIVIRKSIGETMQKLLGQLPG